VRWRRLMLGISLIAVLSGSPARQAEAAGDFARLMAELGGGSGVEPVDGGVGDDSFDAPKAAANGAGALGEITPESPRFAGWCGLLPWNVLLGPGRQHLGSPMVPRLSARSSRRQAWLQRFLF